MSTSGVPQFVRCLKCKKIIKCSVEDPSNLLKHIQDDHPEVKLHAKEKFGKCQTKIKSKSRSNCSIDNTSTKSSKFERSSKDVMRDIAAKTGLSPRKLNVMAGLAGLAGISKHDLAAAANLVGQANAAEGQVPLGDNENPDESFSSTQEEDQKAAEEVEEEDDEKLDPLLRYHKYRTSIVGWKSINAQLFCPNCCCTSTPIIKTRAEVVLPCCSPCLINVWPFCRLPCFLDDHGFYLYCPNCSTFLGLYNDETHSVRPNKNYVQVAEELYNETLQWEREQTPTLRACGCTR